MKIIQALAVVMLLVMFTTTSSAQVVVGGQDINQMDNVKYCEIVGQGKLFSSKLKIVIDYGQKVNIWKGPQKIQKSNGKPMVFQSMVDALNFMESNGWEYVNSYVVTVGNQNVYHWLLRKKE